MNLKRTNLPYDVMGHVAIEIAIDLCHQHNGKSCKAGHNLRVVEIIVKEFKMIIKLLKKIILDLFLVFVITCLV